MQYVVTAFCSRPWCHVKEFSELRPKTSFIDGEGKQQPIRYIRCPRCKAQAVIIKTQEVA
ncbi:hypothetical protein [Syntrophotalea acetylenica]|jgi:formate dehydrogenase maturation protein FdhE|uniref:hypothetical protein n=1 Tax=Syntrophotalea acetylenica TaxID=29542 RepID=UPI002A35D7B6|nr:hypothetical protein [Syntrophotalea acetylenica]MDY0262004.1 hypothetical protein [Syntrophotalea acetylenica]